MWCRWTRCGMCLSGYARCNPTIGQFQCFLYVGVMCLLLHGLTSVKTIVWRLLLPSPLLPCQGHTSQETGHSMLSVVKGACRSPPWTSVLSPFTFFTRSCVWHERVRQISPYISLCLLSLQPSWLPHLLSRSSQRLNVLQHSGFPPRFLALSTIGHFWLRVLPATALSQGPYAVAVW